ncbi:uba ts-n domain containing [Fusarium albosuccineum]|uniref:Uba ts-n domain containing n=1 Tax=Fusarium albosuccineum TaxID=1237068 RepID=A0A8H4LEX7_9HYPO|nr:uba ts-n domain containing [Fusarium albosuccineum]
MSPTPTSPRFTAHMPFRSPWHEQIRATGVVDQLKDGRYDLFPLEKCQALTNNLLKPSLFNRGAQHGTQDADIILVGELAPFENENFALEAAVLACLHAFSPEAALGQLRKARGRCYVHGPLFFQHARAYLQFLILACDIRPDLYLPDDLPSIAKDLFDVVKERDAKEPFPSVLGVLRVVGKETCEEHLPPDLVQMMLRDVSYKEKLRIELHKLRGDRKWHSAYRLVGGSRELSRKPAAARLLPHALPDRVFWMPWAPDRSRIIAWEKQLSDSDRNSLAYAFDLEGPDTTGHQRQLLRYSSSGVFGLDTDHLLPVNGRQILDSFLEVVDRVVARGPEAISLLKTVCIKPKQLNWQVLDRIEAALELNSLDGIRALDAYMRDFSKGDLSERVQACTTVLTTSADAPRLQNVFGNSRDLARRAYRVFAEAAGYLCEQLDKRQASERFAINTAHLGHALASATWLHEYWQDGFIEELKGIPDDYYISSTFKALRTSSGDQYFDPCDDLASRVCLSKRAGAVPADVSRPPRLSDNPIFSISLDRDRAQLRDMLYQESLEGFSHDEAAACVRQSQREHDSFVRKVRDLLMVANSDMACVNLAAWLGRQHASGGGVTPPEECWRQLLMHKMRRRPSGLMERVGDALTTSKNWVDWMNHLQWLYGDRHFDPEGGLGFTPEGFRAVTTRKMGIGRSISMSTNSTGSSGGSGLFSPRLSGASSPVSGYSSGSNGIFSQGSSAGFSGALLGKD